MGGNFSNHPHILKNGQKSYSFAAHFERKFNYTMSRTYLPKCMAFTLLKLLNPIGTIKTYMKPNCNLCMEERLTITRKIREKCELFMNKKSEIYRTCGQKTTFCRFFLSTDDPV